MTQAVAVAMRKVRPLSQRVGSSILYTMGVSIRVGVEFARHPIGATVSPPLPLPLYLPLADRVPCRHCQRAEDDPAQQRFRPWGLGRPRARRRGHRIVLRFRGW